MKVLVCGSRGWTDSRLIEERIAQLPEACIVIQGGADGADWMAWQAAQERGLWVASVPVEGAHWKKYGRSAGHKRNAAMLDLEPDLVIAFSLGTNGTQGTIDEARRRGIAVEVIGVEAKKEAA